jgi:tRNA (cytidine/uridine-2'-O-)-methyltransferase
VKIILYSPQIPQNTGNIARTCAATGAVLTLVRPLGFSISDKHMKRAGLDYWDRVNLEVVDDLEETLTPEKCYFFSSKTTRSYTEASFEQDAQLIFGSETDGLPDFLWDKYPDRFYTIPMKEGQRCLNLATSAAIVLYESLRQNNFCFKEKTELFFAGDHSRQEGKTKT